MKIAIDGPSASGKGTVSKILAKKLNAEYLNTGKIYRIIALLASKEKGNLVENALKIAQEIDFHFKEQAENDEIYTEEIARITSEIAKIPEIRNALILFQQNFANSGKSVILEGRDIGTIIMPNAEFKFFLDANAEERAKRRVLQLKSSGKPANFEEILEDIKKRDENDTNRSIAELKIAPDAYYLDTSSKTIEEVIDEIIKVIKG
jgi:cytidylate kinase